MSVGDLSTRVEYRQIERFPGYRFGDDGSVWSCRKRAIKGVKGFVGYESNEWRRLTPSVTSHGYLTVKPRNARTGKYLHVFVHALILEAFDRPRPAHLQCRHLDGDRRNNRLDNIEWSTPKVNNDDKYRHGTRQIGERAGTAKLTWAKVDEIRRLKAEGSTFHGLAERFGVSSGSIQNIIYGKTWTCGPPA